MSVPAPSATKARTGGWFAGRPVALKIGAALAVLALVATGLATLGVVRINTLADAADKLNTGSIVPLERLGEAQRTFQGTRARNNLYAGADAATRQELQADLEERRAQFDAEIDDAARQEIAQQIAAIMTEEVPAIIPFFINGVTFVRSNVQGYVPDRIGFRDLRFTYLSTE